MLPGASPANKASCIVKKHAGCQSRGKLFAPGWSSAGLIGPNCCSTCALPWFKWAVMSQGEVFAVPVPLMSLSSGRVFMKDYLLRRHRAARSRRGQRGQTLIIIAFLSVFLIVLLGLVVDTVRLYILTAQAERIAEAAA